MGERSLIEEGKLWIPFFVVSAIGLEMFIVGFGYHAMDVFTIYIMIAVFLSMTAASTGRFFNYAWLTAYVDTQRRLEGSCAVVTGANSGSGYETAKELVIRGCDVIITCRSKEKATTTIERIRKELLYSGINYEKTCGKLDYTIMDLCSKKSVDLALNDLINIKKAKINILINNAGAWLQTATITEDGIESQWQANYFAPFYFTKKLLPIIKRVSSKDTLHYGRIVNVSSIGHMFATIEVFNAFISPKFRGDINFWKTKQTQNVYGETKCAQILHAKKLQEILNVEKDNHDEIIGNYLFVMSVHPGYLNSNFARIETRPVYMRIAWSIIYPFVSVFAMISSKQGSQTILHCVLSNSNIIPGGYHADCKPQDTKKSAKQVLDTKCDELYDASDAMWN